MVKRGEIVDLAMHNYPTIAGSVVLLDFIVCEQDPSALLGGLVSHDETLGRS